MGFRHVGQAGLKLLTSGDLPTLASQSAGITGVSHHGRLHVLFFLLYGHDTHGPILRALGLLRDLAEAHCIRQAISGSSGPSQNLSQNVTGPPQRLNRTSTGPPQDLHRLGPNISLCLDPHPSPAQPQSPWKPVALTLSLPRSLKEACAESFRGMGSSGRLGTALGDAEHPPSQEDLVTHQVWEWDRRVTFSPEATVGPGCTQKEGLAGICPGEKKDG
ncbi:Protein GVQW1 [Plecturocebus cupreus]